MRYSAAIRNTSGRPTSATEPDDRAGDVAQAAQDHDGQRQDGLLRVERLVIDVGIQMRRDAAADARSESAENEGQCLIAIEAETIGARGDIIVANGAKTAADMRTEQPHLQQREHDHDREAEPVDRATPTSSKPNSDSGGIPETPIGPCVTVSQFRMTSDMISPIASVAIET